MLRTLLITNDPSLAADAQEADVSRIMVDLETLGKKERQASRTTFISTHRMEDIAPVRAALDKAELIVRVNPWHDGSLTEIDAAVAGGAERIMIPMIEDMAAFARMAEAVAGRAALLPLLETAYSAAHCEDILAHEAVDEIYIGLNDLHLSLGMAFLFEPLATGLVDKMAAAARRRRKPFGFGGIATVGSGELPAQDVLAEHARLGSSCVILSSRFCRDVALDRADGRIERLVAALQAMRECWDALCRRSAGQVESDRLRVRVRIEDIAAGLRKSIRA